MNVIFKEFPDSGTCVIDLPILYKKWNKLFVLSKYREDYTLVKTKGKDRFKAKISQEQALEIIKELQLCQIQDTTFASASTFMTKEVIADEIIRLWQIKEEKARELEVVTNVIFSYKEAIINKVCQ